jgi:hypothetical protein
MSVLGTISAVLGIIGLLITLITIIVKLNTSITKLTCAADGLKEYADENTRFHGKVSDTLTNHETRITVLEDWRKGG